MRFWNPPVVLKTLQVLKKDRLGVIKLLSPEEHKAENVAELQGKISAKAKD